MSRYLLEQPPPRPEPPVGPTSPFATRTIDRWREVRAGLLLMLGGAVILVGLMAAFSLGHLG